MPDSSAVNVQLAERTESELQRVDREMSLLQERKLSHRGAACTGQADVSAGGRGRQARRPGRSSSSPRTDCARCRPSMQTPPPSMAPTTPTCAACSARSLRSKRRAAAGARGDPAEQRRKLEAELAAAKDRYGEDHPDVQRLQALDCRARGARTAKSSARRRPPNGVPRRARRSDRTIPPTCCSPRSSKACSGSSHSSPRSRTTSAPSNARTTRGCCRFPRSSASTGSSRATTTMRRRGTARSRRSRCRPRARWSSRRTSRRSDSAWASPRTCRRSRTAPTGPASRCWVCSLRLAAASDSPCCASSSIRPSRGRSSLRASPTSPILTPIPYIETQRERPGKRRKVRS